MASYRFHFNGVECDDEIKGSGNSFAFTYRIHDPRLGRFLSVDPLTKEYIWYTPYQFAGNKPIAAIDLEGLEEYWVIARSFIPAPKLDNPDPLTFTQYPAFKGDNRTAYLADAGSSFRTEQYANVNFNNRTIATNQFANGTIALNASGNYVASSNGSQDAGKVQATMYGQTATVNFVIDASNQLVMLAPSINAQINLTITTKADGTFDYTLNIPEMDGFPAYELWINDDKGNSYLIFGRNPNESGETPWSLFGSGEHQYTASGNSANLVSKPVQTFEESPNPQCSGEECTD
jgi:RHS repeat-associated protein